MTRTARKLMLQEVIADRVKLAAYKAFWSYSQRPRLIGSFLSLNFSHNHLTIKKYEC